MLYIVSLRNYLLADVEERRLALKGSGLEMADMLSKCRREKGMVKGLVVCPCMSKTLGSPSSGATPLEVLVYGDVNMTGVDIVKET